MNLTRALLQQRKPMIRFLGKRSPPTKVDHAPHPHPASPSSTLPSSFASYRQKAQQHGPLNPKSATPASPSRSLSSSQGRKYGGQIGASTGAQLGRIEADKGEVFDSSELPVRFRRRRMEGWEIEAVDSAGGSMHA